jgi:hypothetical protein
MKHATRIVLLLVTEVTISVAAQESKSRPPAAADWAAHASGQVETWGFEGMSPNFLARRGWTRTSLLPGMRITVTFRPLRDGKAGGMFMTGKLGDGKVLTSAGAE